MTTTNPTTTLPKPRRRWVKVLLTLIVFLAGMIAGGALVVGVVVNRVQNFLHHPDEAPARLTSLLRRRLDLSPDQASRVETILRARQSALQKIRREIEPQVTSEFRAARQEIGAVLNDDQRKKWEHNFDEMLQRWWTPASATQPAN